jgi:hypothetical protein
VFPGGFSSGKTPPLLRQQQQLVGDGAGAHGLSRSGGCQQKSGAVVARRNPELHPVTTTEDLAAPLHLRHQRGKNRSFNSCGRGRGTREIWRSPHRWGSVWRLRQRVAGGRQRRGRRAPASLGKRVAGGRRRRGAPRKRDQRATRGREEDKDEKLGRELSTWFSTK